MTNIITKDNLIRDFENIGVNKGDLLHIKVSMRALGNVDGGAKTVLDAILETIGEERTLISDAFVPVFPLPLTKKQKEIIYVANSPSYAGAFVNEMIKHPKMKTTKFY